MHDFLFPPVSDRSCSAGGSRFSVDDAERDPDHLIIYELEGDLMVAAVAQGDHLAPSDVGMLAVIAPSVPLDDLPEGRAEADALASPGAALPSILLDLNDAALMIEQERDVQPLLGEVVPPGRLLLLGRLRGRRTVVSGAAAHHAAREPTHASHSGHSRRTRRGAAARKTRQAAGRSAPAHHHASSAAHSAAGTAHSHGSNAWFSAGIAAHTADRKRVV